MFKILINFLVLLLLNSPNTLARDFYKILGIGNASSGKAIKRAFRKLSLKYHPDKCDDCKDKFTDVNAAYDVLGDAKKRQVYDSFNGDEDKYKQKWTQMQSGGFGGFQRNDETPRAADTKLALRVDLRTLYLGSIFEMRFFRDTLCQRVDECEKSDSGCARAGVRKSTRRLGGIFVQQIEEIDTRCVAEGKKYLDNCKACPDGSTVADEIPVTVDISPGMRHEQELIFEEYGDEKIGHIPGNLIIVLKQMPHKHFSRDGDDLKLRIGIDLVDALVGFERTIQHVDGHDVLISSDEVIDCPYVKIIKNEGMPKESGGFGDLILTFEIEFPSKKFKKDEKDMLRQILQK